MALAATQRQGVEPRKIVFVNRFFHPDESATSRMLSDLAFRLAAHGMRVAVVTSRQLYENPGARLAPHALIQAVRVWRIPTATWGRGTLLGRALDYATFHLSAALTLARLLEPGDVVVAKTDPPLISVIVSWIAWLRGASLVNWLQDVFPEVAAALTPGVLPRWLQSFLAQRRDHSLKRAALNVVIGNAMAARLVVRGISAEQIRVIPNWADCEAITPMDCKHSATRARLQLQDRFVLGYSGNFGRAHEFETLVAAAGLLADDAEFAFLMTGGGTKNQALRAAVARAGLTSFHFQGYQPATLLSDSMAAADLHLVSLLPAIEGLIVPSKAYSILAAGRPLIFVGDTRGELAQLIRQHDCGMVVAIGDGQGLADALRALRNAPETRATMGTNARRLALARYTSDQAASAWIDLVAGISHRKAVGSHS